MITAGVTGAIGSGKTTVCKIWEKKGARVVYADELARELMVTNHELRKKLTAEFGQETYNDDGSLNKDHLIRKAFKEGRVEVLNRLVHPIVAKRFKEICREAEKSGEEMVVEEAALLLNRGRPDYFDTIVIVESTKDARVQRVVSRDNVTVEDVLARAENQPDFNKLTELADYIVLNNGTLKELEKEALRVYESIIKEHS